MAMSVSDRRLPRCVKGLALYKRGPAGLALVRNQGALFKAGDSPNRVGCVCRRA